jgi:hypothetical protein
MCKCAVFCIYFCWVQFQVKRDKIKRNGRHQRREKKKEMIFKTLREGGRELWGCGLKGASISKPSALCFMGKIKEKQMKDLCCFLLFLDKRTACCCCVCDSKN